jgi:hypothetical protein
MLDKPKRTIHVMMALEIPYDFNYESLQFQNNQFITMIGKVGPVPISFHGTLRDWEIIDHPAAAPSSGKHFKKEGENEPEKLRN